MSIGQLDSPALLPQMTEVPITNLMYIIWLSRLDLQSAFDIKTESGQRNYLNWFRVSVFREYGLDPNMHLILCYFGSRIGSLILQGIYHLGFARRASDCGKNS